MPLWDYVTHVFNDTNEVIKACVEDDNGKPTDFEIDRGQYRKCRTTGGKITVSAYRKSKGEAEKVRGSYYAHTSVIVRNRGDGIEIWPAKMGTIKTPTEDGTEERTIFDSAVETLKTVLPLKGLFSK